jgi:hypothetical protein
MQRVLSLIIALVILAFPLANIGSAQDGKTTFTSEAGLTFTYPEEWVVKEKVAEDESDALVDVFVSSDETLLINPEDDTEMEDFLDLLGNNTFTAGQIVLDIAVADMTTDTSGLMGGFGEMPPAVQTGYFMGIIAFALSFGQSFSGDATETATLTLTGYEDIEFHNATGGLITYEYGNNDGALFMVSLDETHILYMFAITASGEIETQMETIMQILDSIEYTPPTE